MPIKVEARMRMWAVIGLCVYLCLLGYFRLAPEPSRVSKTIQTHTMYGEHGTTMTTNKTVREYRVEGEK